jgi:flagellar biosynthesis protein FlhG
MRAARETTLTEPVALPRVRRGDEARVISVTGGKGGVGKSAVAVNLALALGQLGGRVLLVDGDLGLANADLLLGVRPRTTIREVLHGEACLEDALCHVGPGVTLMAASSGRTDAERLGAREWSRILPALRGMAPPYDCVVVDIAAGIGDAAMRMAASADHVLVVVTPEPTSLRDAYAVMKVLSKELEVGRAEVVINKASCVADGPALFGRLSKVVGKYLPLTVGLAGTVVQDECFARSVMEQRPLMTAYPGAAACKQISAMARGLVRVWNTVEDLRTMRLTV